MDKQTRLCPECGKEGWLEVADTRTTPTPPAGQIEAVADAIQSVPLYLPLGHQLQGKYSYRKEIALQAIKASGAEHVRGLVDYLKCFVNAGAYNLEHRPDDIGYHVYISKEMHDKAVEVFTQLPEHLKGNNHDEPR